MFSDDYTFAHLYLGEQSRAAQAREQRRKQRDALKSVDAPRSIEPGQAAPGERHLTSARGEKAVNPGRNRGAQPIGAGVRMTHSAGGRTSH